MKFIYKTKNLALTALVGAALAMGTPAAMAQSVGDNVTPTTPDDQTSADNYQDDLDLLKYYMDFVKIEAARYQEDYEDLYEEIFAPTVDDVIKQIQDMLDKVEAANKAALADGEDYVSPITEEFKDELFKEFKQMASDAVDIRVAQAMDEVQKLGDKLNSTVAELSEIYEENVAPHLLDSDAAEAFFLDEEDSDKILAEINDMGPKIAEAAEHAQEVDFEKFDSPVTEAWIEDIEAKIQKLYDKSYGRIELSKTMIEQHDVNVDYVQEMETAANEAWAFVIDRAKKELGEEIEFTPEEEEFFGDEPEYKPVEEAIEAYRKAMVEAATAAQKDNWQSYNAQTLVETIPAFEAAVEKYKEDALYLVQNAQAMLQQHDEDIELIQRLEEELADAQKAIAEKYNEVVGEDTDLSEGDMELATNAAEFNAIQAQIDKLREAMVAEAEKAAADHWQSYSQEATGVEEHAQAIYEEILAYQQDGLDRIDHALDAFADHDKDVDAIKGVEDELAQKLEELQTLYTEILEPELGAPTEEAEAFFYDKEKFNSLQASIEGMRERVVKAYEESVKGNMAHYNSPIPENWVDLFNKELQEEYYDVCEYRIKNAQANLQQHDEDIEYLDGLESQLAEAAQKIADKYNEVVGDAELTEETESELINEAANNAIQAQIDKLRDAMVAEAEKAAADNWQSYSQEDTGIEEKVYELEQEIAAYQTTGLKNVETMAPVIIAHDANIATLTALDGKLMEAAQNVQALYAEKLEEVLGEPTEEQEAFFYDEKTFEAIQALIATERKAAGDAYEKAKDGSQAYESPVTDEWVAEVESKINDYYDECEYRVLNALAQYQLFEEDLELVQGLDTELFAAVTAAQNHVMEILGVEELTDEEEEFFLDEKAYNELSAKIDALRQSVVAANEAAAADNWQNYDQEASGVKAQAQALYEAIVAYQDDCEYLANNLQAQQQLHDEDVELIQALESELLAAVTAAQNHIMEILGVDELTDEEEEFFLDEKTYNEIAAKIDALHQSVAAAYEKAEADNWQNYDQEASGVKENAQAIYEEILKYQDDCEYLANNLQAQMQLHDEDVDLIQALDAELYNAVVGIQEVMQEKLGEEIEISDEMAEFFQDEETFDALQAQIDALRQSAAAAYEKAEADNWQNYDQEASGVKEHAQEIYEAIVEYKDECEFRVNNAQANIQLHGEDAEMYYDLSAALQAAFDEVATEADDNIDADILEGIRDYLVVDGYDAVLAQIDALQAAMVKQYEVAEADNWQKYEQQIVPNATEVDEAIAQYKEESGARVLKALASIEAHQYDLDVLLPLDEMLGDGIAELMEEHPELFEEGSEFIDQYEALSAQIEEIWKEIAAAATEAEEDNWQSYNSVCTNSDVQALYLEVEDFLATAWGDNGTINLHLWEADNDAVIALESELVAAVESIQQNNPDYNVDPEFDAIQAAIDALRHKMADAYEAAEAEAWESYECPYTQADLDAVEAMIDEMVAHSQGTSAIEGVNAGNEQPMIFSIDGKRLSAPVKGELNIFIYKNRVEKKIVK